LEYGSELLKDGHSELEVEGKLKERGFDQKSILFVVNSLLGVRCSALKARGKRSMSSGALLVMIGFFLLIFAYGASKAC